MGPDVSSIPRRLGRRHPGTAPGALWGIATLSLFNTADDCVTTCKCVHMTPSVSAWEGRQETERQDDGCGKREVKGERRSWV